MQHFFYSICKTKQYVWWTEESGMSENKSIANKTQEYTTTMTINDQEQKTKT